MIPPIPNTRVIEIFNRDYPYAHEMFMNEFWKDVPDQNYFHIFFASDSKSHGTVVYALIEISSGPRKGELIQIPAHSIKFI